MKPYRESRAVVLAALTLGVGVACGPPQQGYQPYSPGGDPQARQARLAMIQGASSPLVVDWRPEERGQLEMQLRRGPALVRFDEQSLEVLRDCQADGSYQYGGFSPKEQSAVLQSPYDLHANMPRNAAQLEGHLARSGSVSVTIRMVGEYRLDRPTIWRNALRGSECAYATHFVRQVTVGAFRMSSGASQQASVGGSSIGAQAGGQSSTLNEDGDLNACSAAQLDAPTAPPRCSALVRIELVPLATDAAPPPPAPDCGEGLRWDGSACVSAQ